MRSGRWPAFGTGCGYGIPVWLSLLFPFVISYVQVSHVTYVPVLVFAGGSGTVFAVPPFNQTLSSGDTG